MTTLPTTALKTLGCFAVAVAALPAAAATELPAQVIGSWTRQASAQVMDARLVLRRDGAAEIEGAPCELNSVRAIHGTRWYADFTCGARATASPVWLDIHLLADNRIVVSRRPLGEADVYVRRIDQHASPRPEPVRLGAE